MNKNRLIIFCLIFVGLFLSWTNQAQALPFGALLYRTSESGEMFGRDTDFKLYSSLIGVQPGAVGIYIGQNKETGQPQIVQVERGKVEIVPAEQFINLDKGEKLIAVMVPREAKELWEDDDVIYEGGSAGKPIGTVTGKEIFLKHILEQEGEGFDYTYHEQKGPSYWEWTGVGLAEMLYESGTCNHITYGQIQMPEKVGPIHIALVKPQPAGCATNQESNIDITPNGYDDQSIVNADNDCLSRDKEFSRIHKVGRGDYLEELAFDGAKTFTEDTIGLNLDSLTVLIGKEHEDQLYMFFPYTQYLQDEKLEKIPLEEVKVVLASRQGNSRDAQMLAERDWAIVRRTSRVLGEDFVQEWGLVALAPHAPILAKAIDLIDRVKLTKKQIEKFGRFLASQGVELSLDVDFIKNNFAAGALKHVTSALSTLGQWKDDFVNRPENEWKGVSESDDLLYRGLFGGPEARAKVDEFLATIEAEEVEITEEELQEIIAKNREALAEPTEQEKIWQDEQQMKQEDRREKEEEEKRREEQMDFEKREELRLGRYQASDVVINEFVSHPAQGEKEWIELFNNTGQNIPLRGWSIEDGTGERGNISLEGLVIPPHGYLILTKGENFSFGLNNEGDVITLKCQDRVIDQAGYGDFATAIPAHNIYCPEQGLAAARSIDGVDSNKDVDDFGITTEPTPGLPNIISVVEEELEEEEELVMATKSYQRHDVVINEIAWMGTPSNYADEWMELRNATDQEINLKGWSLIALDGSVEILLEGKIPAQGYFLLERTDDTAISNVEADQIYSGALSNFGVHLQLRDGHNSLIDEVDCANGWFAGENYNKGSMERENPAISGNERTNWHTNDGSQLFALDVEGQTILGTPKAKNSPEQIDYSSGGSGSSGGEDYLPEEDEEETINYNSYAAGDVVINEIAWMGTKGGYHDEWMELFNNLDSEINLSGWRLISQDGSPDINLSGIIPAQGYFLLERTDESSISDIQASQIYAGSLNNNGEYLKLIDGRDNLIDEVDCANGWFAGDNDSKASMERSDSLIDGNPDNWHTNEGQIISGLDKEGNPIIGTPKQENSSPPEEFAEEEPEPEEPEEEEEQEPEQKEEEPEKEEQIEEDVIAPETVLISYPEKIIKEKIAEFIFSSDETFSVFECKLDDDSWEKCCSPKQYSNLSDGSYSFQVRARDQAGNVDATPAEYNRRVDTCSPEIQLSAKPSSPTNQRTAYFEFQANEEAQFSCRLNQGKKEERDSSIQYDDLSEGEYTFYLEAVDLAGNKNNLEYGWVVDTTSPLSNIDTEGIFNSWPGIIQGTAFSNDSFTDIARVKLQIHNEKENTYLGYATSSLAWIKNLSWVETELGHTTSTEIGWTFEVQDSLITDGQYQVSSLAYDAAGNVQSTASTASFIFDSRPPEKIEGLKVERKNKGLEMNISWQEGKDNFSGIDYYEIDLGQGHTTSTPVTFFELKGNPDQEYLFKVRSVDKAGNKGNWEKFLIISKLNQW